MLPDSIGMLQLLELLTHGCAKVGTKGLAELLSNPAATAALASALGSALKLCMLITKQELGVEVTDSTEQATAASRHDMPGNLTWPFQVAALLQRLSGALLQALRDSGAAAVSADQLASSTAREGGSIGGSSCSGSSSGGSNSSGSSSSSSSGDQVRASAVLLCVLLCRGIVSQHEAAVCLPPDVPSEAQEGLVGYTLEKQYMQNALDMFVDVCSTLLLSLPDLAAAQAAAPGPPAAAAAAGSWLGQERSSKSVRWQYLLRLHESRKLATAAAAFRNQWKPAMVVELLEDDHNLPAAAGADATGCSGQEQLHQLRQLYQNALAFCRVLTAVAPLPVVCNNLKCSDICTLKGAAAARYMCAGCGCRYCSAACQAASWRGHKKACRRMAACGMRVEGQQ
jgi:hypothetical protein